MKYFSYFSQKLDFDISCKMSPLDGHNLHEMSNPVFWENLEKNHRFVVYLGQGRVGGGGGG